MFKKDFHVSYRINLEMLKFYESFMNDVFAKTGEKIPQSQVLRAMIAVIREDKKLYDIMTAKISAYIGKNIRQW